MRTFLFLSRRHRLSAKGILASLITAITITLGSPASAQQAFKTPDEAVAALIDAAKTDNQKNLLTVLGPGGADIASSGDAIADLSARRQVIEAYDAKHQIVMKDDKAVLVIGQQDWPLPIPLIQKDGEWRFDTTAGREEILFRRIGRNELDTIQACLAYVDAQNDYAQVTRARGSLAAYAQHIVSRPGKKDGLFWPTQPGESPSPLGDLVASAASEGYRIGGGRAPFHGYYYKVLTRQGPTAPGGAYDYIVHGKMIGGFALVAYPAVYGNSGVMTFLVNHGGIVFQKDLGPETGRIALRVDTFNPDDTWKKVAIEVPAQ